MPCCRRPFVCKIFGYYSPPPPPSPQNKKVKFFLKIIKSFAYPKRSFPQNCLGKRLTAWSGSGYVPNACTPLTLRAPSHPASSAPALLPPPTAPSPALLFPLQHTLLAAGAAARRSGVACV